MINTKKGAFGFGALIQTILNYFINIGLLLNPRVRKYQKLEKICDSLTDKYKWIDYISHWYSVEDYDFDEYETAITIKDGCHDYDHANKENFEHEFLIAIEQDGLSDCVYTRFAYRRFDHDSLEYDYE